MLYGKGTCASIVGKLISVDILVHEIDENIDNKVSTKTGAHFNLIILHSFGHVHRGAQFVSVAVDTVCEVSTRKI